MEKQREAGEKAAAAPAMTLEQITANARAKIAARRAAEAAAGQVDQVENRRQKAEKLAVRTAEKRDQVQTELAATVKLKPEARDRADVEEAKKKVNMYERDLPKAEKRAERKREALDVLRGQPMPPAWNLRARSTRTKAEAAAVKAAEDAQKLVKEIIEFLFGKTGEATRSMAQRPIAQDLPIEIHRRTVRRDQLDARLASLQTVAQEAAQEKARLLAADQDGRAAFTRPAAGAPGQPPRIPKI